MKKIIALIAASALLAISFSSCRKLMCKCEATGYMSQSELQEILNRHVDDCVEIALDGDAVYDDGATITCSF